MSDEAPAFEYWHAWTDAAGVSRQERRLRSGFELQEFTSDHEPLWVLSEASVPNQIVFLTLPAGLIVHWHENPVPQWIVVLSGRWFVETMDGTRVEMGPGDVSFGGDQGTHPRREKRGHQSGALDGKACTLMLVQLDASTHA